MLAVSSSDQRSTQGARQNTRRPRRAMSADQAKMRAQERNYRKIAAAGSGLLPKLQKTMNVTLKTLTGGSIKLVSADGTVTPGGLHYYNNAGVAPPSVFAYEQPVESGKWVRGFDGKKKLVRKMGSDLHWHPTKLGLEYFKYNRDSYHVGYPVRLARPVDNGKKSERRMEWALDKVTFDYKQHRHETTGSQPFTVGQIRESGRLALESNKGAHVRSAAHRFIQTRRKIKAKDPETGEDGPYHIVMYGSPLWYVRAPTRQIRVATERRHLYDRSLPTTDEILQRPMRHFFVVPDGRYRPWDLHPGSLVRDGHCAVTMLHESFTKRCNRQRVWENGRYKYKIGFTASMTEKEIEDELDLVLMSSSTKGTNTRLKEDGAKTGVRPK